MYVEYRSNNSGGDWWLEDADWLKLEAAGWKVRWASLAAVFTPDGRSYVLDSDGMPTLVPVDNEYRNFSRKDEKGVYRHLGAMAAKAYRAGLSFEACIDEWESVLGMDASAEGCPCCGQPHLFTEEK